MSNAEFLSQQSIKVPNPLIPWGYSRIGVGALMGLISGFVVMASLPEVRMVLGSSTPAVNVASSVFFVRIAAAIVVFLVAAGMISRGIGGITRLIVPPRAPSDLVTAEIASALSRRELTAYAVNEEEESYWMLRKWFPNQFPLLTRRMRQVLSTGLREVSVGLKVIAALVLIFGLPSLAPVSVQHQLMAVIPSFPFFFLLMFLAGAACHIFSVFALLPSHAPRVEVSEFRASIRGGGDPAQISHGLQHELAAIRPPDGTPNRSTVSGFDMAGGGVNDAGEFRGSLSIENQPRLSLSPAPSVVNVLLAAGSFVQLASLYWWLKLPEVGISLNTQTNSIKFGTTLAAQFIAAILLSTLGARMIRAGETLLRTFQFRSLAIILDVKGNFARSQVRIGKGVHDSIESENLVVRSDCFISGYTAALLTESVDLLGSRHIVGAVVDDAARGVEELVNAWMQHFEQEAATIVGVNLADRKLVEMVKANLSVDAQRASGRAQATAAAASLGSVPATPAIVAASSPAAYLQDSSTPSQGSDTDVKVCPDCAETVKRAAAKCRFCGYRFDGAANLGVGG